jgi:hypothetical protein
VSVLTEGHTGDNTGDNTGNSTGPRLKLAALWAALMLLYAYADILSFYRPGTLEEISAGMMGPLPATQVSLLMAGLLMALPALMIYLVTALPEGLARWSSIAMGALYTLVTIGNLVGEVWAYYLALGAVETALTLAIMLTAWRWPRDA